MFLVFIIYLLTILLVSVVSLFRVLNVNATKNAYFYSFFSMYFKDVEQTTARHCKKSSLETFKTELSK